MSAATTAVVVNGAFMVASLAGSVVYQRQQKRKMEKAMRGLGGTTVTARDPAAARRIIYGTQRVGGAIVFMSGSGKNNKYLHLVVAIAGHEVSAMRELWFDDYRVPLDANGEAVAPGNDDPDLTGHVLAKFFDGSPDQEACADLMAELPDKWTANHRLRGIAYVYIRLKYNADKFTSMPNVSVLVDGKKVFDPRTGTTGFSANTALCIRDYMKDSAYGFGCSDAEIDDPSFSIAANICDEQVALSGGGFESRYTCNGCIDSDSTPGDVLEAMLESMAGAAIYTGGLWNIRAGAHREPSATFGLDDLRGDITIQTRDSLRDTCNAVKGTYVSEENKWQPADFPPVKNATYYAEDGNERIWRELELAFTTSAATAQRLAKITLERSRQDITVSLPLKLQGMRVRAGDVVALNFDRYGWNQKLFEVMEWKFVVDDAELVAGGSGGNGSGPVLGVDVELRETAAGVWDWNSGEETTVDLAPNTDLPDFRSIADPRNLALGSDVIVQPDGGTVSRLLATWDQPLDEFVVSGGNIFVEYKAESEAEWAPWASVSGEKVSAVVVGVKPGIYYRVRLRSQNTQGALGAWVVSGTALAAGDTTPPGAPSGLSALGIFQGVRLRWTNPADSDLAFVEVYEASAATPAPTSESAAYARIYGNEYIRQGLTPAQTRYYWIRAVDNSGNRSAWVGSASATAQAVDTGQLTGKITGTQIDTNAVQTPHLAANVVTAEKVGANQIITTSANIAALVVDTLHLKGQAVTIPVSAHTSASMTIAGNNTWQTIQTASIVSSGAPIAITFGFVGEVSNAYLDNGAWQGVRADLRLQRNGTTIFTLGAQYVLSSMLHAISDLPGAGAATYTLSIYGPQGPSVDVGTVRNRVIQMMETKK
ncbi:hypothetical protein OpiT1DRAFT_01308 [Opitutaceae bacterium TAV1]|nr:hypothetical protein OpiT1DRAFT_01308 [Opitutaceae bacterium TAV1]